MPKVLRCGECGHKFLPCQSECYVPNGLGKIVRAKSENQPDICPECTSIHFYEVQA